MLARSCVLIRALSRVHADAHGNKWFDKFWMPELDVYKPPRCNQLANFAIDQTLRGKGHGKYLIEQIVGNYAQQCYFWRKFGTCKHGSNCWNAHDHLPQHKGSQKKKGSEGKVSSAGDAKAQEEFHDAGQGSPGAEEAAKGAGYRPPHPTESDSDYDSSIDSDSDGDSEVGEGDGDVSEVMASRGKTEGRWWTQHRRRRRLKR